MPTPTDSPSTRRAALRSQVRALRRSLSPLQQQQAANGVKTRVLWALRPRKRARIGAYWPTDGELDPRPLMRALRGRGCKIYLPWIAGVAVPMRFARLTACKAISPGRFGIARARGGMLSAYELDIVLVPLVAFSAEGTRLGRGAGFYDRTFVHGPRPRLIGLAHDLQEAHIPREPWDVRLDMIVTPTRVVRV